MTLAVAAVAAIIIATVNVVTAYSVTRNFWNDYPRIRALSKSRAVVQGLILHSSGFFVGHVLVRLFGSLLIPADYIAMTFFTVAALGLVAGLVPLVRRQG